jgi:hypothetical protein
MARNIFKDQGYKGLSRDPVVARWQLMQLMLYCVITGEFTWRVSTSNRVKAGAKAGTLSNGYVRIQLNGKICPAHRLVWLYTHGAWPVGDVDHIDRNPSNNRISNLRECSRSENGRNVGLQRNNSSGFKGVNWDKGAGKFRAHAHVNGKLKHLGYFLSAEAANAARTAHEQAQDCEFYASARK